MYSRPARTTKPKKPALKEKTIATDLGKMEYNVGTLYLASSYIIPYIYNDITNDHYKKPLEYLRDMIVTLRPSYQDLADCSITNICKWYFCFVRSRDIQNAFVHYYIDQSCQILINMLGKLSVDIPVVEYNLEGLSDPSIIKLYDMACHIYKWTPPKVQNELMSFIRVVNNTKPTLNDIITNYNDKRTTLFNWFSAFKLAGIYTVSFPIYIPHVKEINNIFMNILLSMNQM